MNNTLEVDGVMVQFREVRVLSDVFIKCSTGEIVGLLGRNGCGKSTLLKVIFGDLQTTNKSVRINGIAYSRPYQAENIKYLPQYNFIPSGISVKQAFKSFGANFKEFVKFFPDLDKLHGQRLRELSGGERRIIEIYLIVTSDAKFCLLDEPFSQVMPVHVEQIKALINKAKQSKGVIVVDHLYRHVMEQSDRVYLINMGKTHLVDNRNDLTRLGYTKH